jgi:hypothetical protein
MIDLPVHHELGLVLQAPERDKAAPVEAVTNNCARSFFLTLSLAANLFIPCVLCRGAAR